MKSQEYLQLTNMKPLYARVAISVVDHLYNDLKQPKFRGPLFDARTYDIARNVDSYLSMSYSFRRPPRPQEREKAKNIAIAYWNQKWGIKNPQ